MTSAAVGHGLRRCIAWRKSTFSQGESDCLEITTELAGWVGVRDTKQWATTPLAFPTKPWRQFATQVKNGRLRTH